MRHGDVPRIKINWNIFYVLCFPLDYSIFRLIASSWKIPHSCHQLQLIPQGASYKRYCKGGCDIMMQPSVLCTLYFLNRFRKLKRVSYFMYWNDIGRLWVLEFWLFSLVGTKNHQASVIRHKGLGIEFRIIQSPKYPFYLKGVRPTID